MRTIILLFLFCTPCFASDLIDESKWEAPHYDRSGTLEQRVKRLEDVIESQMLQQFYLAEARVEQLRKYEELKKIKLGRERGE